MAIAFVVTCFDVSLCFISFRCRMLIMLRICTAIYSLYVYIYIYILKRAGTSDILTFVYTTGLLFFGLTFAGTV